MKEYVIQGKYSAFIGWEDLTTEESEADAVAMLQCYDANETTIPHRIVVRSAGDPNAWLWREADRLAALPRPENGNTEA